MFKEKNKQVTVNPEINTDGFEYHALKEFRGKKLIPSGFYFNSKGKYGKQTVLVLKDCFVNLPNWATAIFESLEKDEIEAVKDGRMVICEIREAKTNNGTTTSFVLDDYSAERELEYTRSFA